MTYMIIPIAEITDAMIATAEQTSYDTLRRNENGSLCVLKYQRSTYDYYIDGDPPIFSAYTKYTHGEILVLMEDADWAGDVNP